MCAVNKVLYGDRKGYTRVVFGSGDFECISSWMHRPLFDIYDGEIEGQLVACRPPSMFG